MAAAWVVSRAFRDLWRRVDDVACSALETGALVPIETSCEIFKSGGIPYQLRTLRRANPKTTASRPRKDLAKNPFLPPEPELLIGNVSSSHFVVLNKFNVVGHHLLVVTHKYVSQDDPLTVADFEALLLAMAPAPSLGFYNGGLVGGASQPHRHLQIVPLPLEPSAPGLQTPVDAVIRDDAVDVATCRSGGLPFDHRLVFLTAADLEPERAGWLLGLFNEQCEDLSITEGVPFNFLLTPRWLMVVRRSQECFEGISVNALGFAGSLLVSDAEARRRVMEVGPGEVLKRLV